MSNCSNGSGNSESFQDVADGRASVRMESPEDETWKTDEKMAESGRKRRGVIGADTSNTQS
jgi:hypothetical protein